MAHQMTPEQIEEYTKAFTFFDKDGDGKIATKELGDLLVSIGQRQCKAELEELIREIDNDGNGTIAFEEFLEMMTCLDYTNTERIAVLKDAFQVFDKDGKGLITVKDLRDVMKIIGDKVTEEEVEGIIREIVTDVEIITKDVKVNYAAFLSMMTHLKPPLK